jgi:hypothetical protein
MIKDTLRERRNLNLEGLPLNCPHCITGKMSALPYPKKGTENVSHDSNLLVGNIMVSDSFGPVVSRYGNKYVVEYIDVASCFGFMFEIPTLDCISEKYGHFSVVGKHTIF